MNILHIIGTPGFGGVQTYLLDLNKYNKKYGISRSLLCLYGNRGDLKKKFIQNGVNCFSCTIMLKDKGWRPYRIWKILRRFGSVFFPIKYYRVISSLGPDIIVCEEPSNLNTQLFISRLLRIPFIWHIHNEYQFINVNKTIFKWGFKYWFINNLFIISDSRYLLKKNLKQFKKIIKSFWNCIPIITATSDLSIIASNKDRKDQKNSDQIILGSIGRLTWQKDYELLIKVIAEVRKIINKDIRLKIAGTGPMYDRISALIQELGMEKYVKLLGRVDRNNIAEFLYGLDIYVQSSISEGSPVTIKEAMAAALPIVSTNVGGISEMIRNGETGILVDHDDQGGFIAVLVELIDTIFSDKFQMGKNARRFAKSNFSLETLAKNNYAIYKRILKYRK